MWQWTPRQCAVRRLAASALRALSANPPEPNATIGSAGQSLTYALSKRRERLRLCALTEEEPNQSTGLPCLWSHAHTHRSSCGNGASGFVQDEHDMLCCMAAACLMLLCSEAHATVPAMCCSCMSEVLSLAVFASSNACIFLRALQLAQNLYSTSLTLLQPLCKLIAPCGL